MGRAGSPLPAECIGNSRTAWKPSLQCNRRPIKGQVPPRPYGFTEAGGALPSRVAWKGAVSPARLAVAFALDSRQGAAFLLFWCWLMFFAFHGVFSGSYPRFFYTLSIIAGAASSHPVRWSSELEEKPTRRDEGYPEGAIRRLKRRLGRREPRFFGPITKIFAPPALRPLVSPSKQSTVQSPPGADKPGPRPFNGQLLG